MHALNLRLCICQDARYFFMTLCFSCIVRTIKNRNTRIRYEDNTFVSIKFLELKFWYAQRKKRETRDLFKDWLTEENLYNVLSIAV